MDEQTSVLLIGALSRVWSRIRHFHPEVPGVVLLTAPAPPGAGGRSVLGHFAPLRWRTREEGKKLMHEVVVVAEHLNRKAEDVVETLLHEAAHALNFARCIIDCTASQYHNKKFAAAAEEMGLAVTQVKHYGYALTRMTDEVRDRYHQEAMTLAAVLVHREAFKLPQLDDDEEEDTSTTAEDESADSPKAPRWRYIKATCQCGFNIRVARATLSDTVIRCDSCGEPFLPKG